MRIGTRGSALALAQTRWVAGLLPQSEIVPIASDGTEPDKSRWTSALERALLAGEIDIAVHSAKDLATELPEGLAIVAVPPREDPVDVLIGARSLGDLAPGARVGTSARRRGAQTRAWNAAVDVVPVRGNVDTRLRKLRDGECDALVLARAGLARLGRLDEIGAELDFVPAAGQGALAIEARAELTGDPRLEPLRDAAATRELTAERELVAALGADCDTCVGASARVDGEQLRLRAWVGREDGTHWIADELHGADRGLAARMAERLFAAGAAELLG